MGNPMKEENYGVTWDQAVLLATRHKRTHPALTQPQSLVLDLSTPEGCEAE